MTKCPTSLAFVLPTTKPTRHLQRKRPARASEWKHFNHSASSATRWITDITAVRTTLLYSLLGDYDDEEECSIDNLDACIAEYGEGAEECSIDNLDACGEQESGPNAEESLQIFFTKPVIEVQLAVLVVLSSFLVGLGTLQSLPPIISTLTKYGEITISAIFTVEYFLRWKLKGFSAKYVIEPLAVIDLIAILPGIIKFLIVMGVAVPASLTGGALINLRILRILRLQRVLTDETTFRKFESAIGLSPSDTRPYQLQLARVVVSIFTLLSVTSGLIYSAEHKVNPDIPDYFTSLYFALTTLTTVGFGDIHPVTNAGRWVVSGSILIGSVVVPAQAAALVEALLDRQDEKAQKNNDSSDDDAPSFTQQQKAVATVEVLDRLERLEEKLDETNARLDQVVTELCNLRK